MLRWIIFVIIYTVFGLYAFQALKTATKISWLHYLYIVVSLLAVGNFIYQFSVGNEGRVISLSMSYAFGLLLSVMAFNLVLLVFLFFEDIVRVLAGVYSKFFGVSKEFALPSRRRFFKFNRFRSSCFAFWSIIVWYGKR